MSFVESLMVSENRKLSDEALFAETMLFAKIGLLDDFIFKGIKVRFYRPVEFWRLEFNNAIRQAE